MLKELCKNSDSNLDDFVGLRFVDDKPRVYFPRGYELPDDEKQAQKDILRLIATLQKFSGRYEGINNNARNGEEALNFPILSYQHIIRDFLAHGYYTENEVEYKNATRGKINWKRTIQKVNPEVNNGNVVYLDFIIKTNKINSNNLITKIHQYCVYESFQKLGWLYLGSATLPPRPQIKLNKKVFISVLKAELGNTFNTNKKLLFQSMINIIEQASEKINDLSRASFGVYRFEYVWENMIDYVFGEDNKEDYFPHAQWHIIKPHGGYKTESSALEPDTIMEYDGKIYILDAKYYKFGVTDNPGHLPGSSSIEKQIVYGEFVEKNKGYNSNEIFNAFVMPFNAKEKGCEQPYKFVSVGTADWKPNDSDKNYHYVLGILLDTRHIIDTYAKHNLSEIEEMSELIEQSLSEYLA